MVVVMEVEMKAACRAVAAAADWGKKGSEAAVN